MVPLCKQLFIRPMLITVNHIPELITREFAWLQVDKYRNLLLEYLSELDRFAFGMCCIETHCSARKHRRARQDSNPLSKKSSKRRKADAHEFEVEEEDEDPPQDIAQGDLETIENPDANLQANIVNSPLYGYPHYHIAAFFFAKDCKLPNWMNVTQTLLRPPFKDCDVKEVNTRKVLSVQKAFAYVLKDFNHGETMKLIHHYSSRLVPYSILCYFNQEDVRNVITPFVEGLASFKIPILCEDSTPLRGKFSEQVKVPYSNNPYHEFIFAVCSFMCSRRLAYNDGYIYSLVKGSEYTFEQYCEFSRFIMKDFCKYADHKLFVIDYGERFINFMSKCPENATLPSFTPAWNWIEFNDSLYDLFEHQWYTKHPDLDIVKIGMKGQPTRFYDVPIPYDAVLLLPKKPICWIHVLETSLNCPQENIRQVIITFAAQFAKMFLSKKHREPCMFLHGSSRTGKSLIIQPIKEFFPRSMVAVPNTGTENFVSAIVHGARAIVCDDFHRSHMRASDLLRIAGGEMMTMNEKRMPVKGKSFTVDAPLIMASNLWIEEIYPKVPVEIKEALRARFNLWDFNPRSLEERDDPTLFRKIVRETPSVIYFCQYCRVKMFEATQDEYYLP